MSASSRLRLSCLAAVLTVAASCSRLTPAGFWTRYHADAIVDQFSDQGPWGGTRWVQWVAPAPGTFTSAGAVQFAASNGWKCERPVHYTAEQIRSWQLGKDFPRHIDGESWVVQCASGWIRVAPGSGEESPAYGYIQGDPSGTRMAVYHLWGEV